MISLTSPITITLPTLSGVSTASLTLSQVDYSVVYDNSLQKASAKIKGLDKPVVLWIGAEYDAAGQFTDSDVSARLQSILGTTDAEITVSLQNLANHIKVHRVPAPAA